MIRFLPKKIGLLKVLTNFKKRLTIKARNSNGLTQCEKSQGSPIPKNPTIGEREVKMTLKKPALSPVRNPSCWRQNKKNRALLQC